MGADASAGTGRSRQSRRPDGPASEIHAPRAGVCLRHDVNKSCPCFDVEEYR